MSPNDPFDGQALSQIESSSAFQVCIPKEFNTLPEQQNIEKNS